MNVIEWKGGEFLAQWDRSDGVCWKEPKPRVRRLLL